MQQVNSAVVEQQPDEGDAEEFGKLNLHRLAVVVESPVFVPEKIVDDRQREADRIGQVGVEAQFFLEQPGSAEVYDHAADADDAELDELEKGVHAAKKRSKIDSISAPQTTIPFQHNLQIMFCPVVFGIQHVQTLNGRRIFRAQGLPRLGTREGI